jgi:restriction system protein
MPTAKQSKLPSFQDLMNPTLSVLRRLGGSASIQELVDEVIADLGLIESVTEIPHGDTSGTEVGYRHAWARTYLKKAGLLDNSGRGVWALTKEGMKTNTVNPTKIVKEVRQKYKDTIPKTKEKGKKQEEEGTEIGSEPEEFSWQEDLLKIVLDMDPIAFERLCQRMLRESGFLEVEVTQRSGDGGIDGYGTIRVGGMISFNVLFQSKRYKGSIGPSVVRDFRGAMVGRADKGIIITTGTFTGEARKEATRDGAPPIDLMDGELLVTKLKELKLGVEVALIEEVKIDKDWFAAI